MSRDADVKVDPKLARLFDKRTVERNIKKGLVTRKDYDKYLKTLEDVAGKGLYGSAEQKGGGDDGPDLDDVDEADDDEADEADESASAAPAAAPAPGSPLDGESH
jgi:hypothetical protein